MLGGVSDHGKEDGKEDESDEFLVDIPCFNESLDRTDL